LSLSELLLFSNDVFSEEDSFGRATEPANAMAGVVRGAVSLSSDTGSNDDDVCCSSSLLKFGADNSGGKSSEFDLRAGTFDGEPNDELC